MAFDPRHELPVTAPGQDGPWPNNLQQPIQTRRIIDASQNFFDTTANPDAAGDQVVNYYAASIGNFVATQRRDYASGINQQQNRFLTLPGLAMRYENNQGMERLTLVAQPESFRGGGGSDTNNDGYIALVTFGLSGGTVQGSLTFDLRVNGTSVGTFTCATNAPSAVVMKFGSTALRCQSLADKNNPNTLTAPCLPPRADTTEFQNTGLVIIEGEIVAGNQQVSPHKDVFGYFIYDWNLLLNQHQNPDSALLLNKFPIQVIECDPTLLNNKGLNTFRAHLTSTVVNGMYAYFVMESEFYSRSEFRTGSQSWTQRADPPFSVTFNDKPLHFAIRCPIAVDLPLNMDLTPQTVDNSTPTPYQAFTGDASLDGSAPYCNGYWRLGDGPSSYTGQINDPWAVFFGIVSGYYNFLTNLLAFFNNEYQGFSPKMLTIDGVDYTVTDVFFASPFESIVASPELQASYIAVYEAAMAQSSKWTTNYNTAVAALADGSVFYADPNVLSFTQVIYTDAMSLANTLTGGQSLPPVDPTPFWLSVYESGGAIITDPTSAQDYVRSNTIYDMMDSLINTIIPSADDDVQSAISSFLAAMSNYQLPSV